MKRKLRVLKVGRPFAREKGLLWDKMYLVPRKDQEIIPKLFDYSVVMKLTKDLREKIRKSIVFTHPDFGHSKVEQPVYKDYPIERVKNPEKNFKLSLLKDEDWVIIPVLPKWDSLKKRLKPLYLNCTKHRAEKTKQNRPNYYSYNKPEDFPEDAYIQTPKGSVTPVCALCTHSMDGMMDKCRLGGHSCYEGLVFAKSSYFKKKFAAGKTDVDEDLKDLEGGAEVDVKEVENV